jgi:hypothetical protein
MVFDHPGGARMTSERSSDHGFAMTWSRSDHLTCGRSPHHGKAMTWSLCDHLTCGRSPRHGKAMTWSQSDHLMCGLRPHHACCFLLRKELHFLWDSCSVSVGPQKWTIRLSKSFQDDEDYSKYRMYKLLIKII